jgi:hypothetical protein
MRGFFSRNEGERRIPVGLHQRIDSNVTTGEHNENRRTFTIANNTLVDLLNAQPTSYAVNHATPNAQRARR